LQSGELSFCQPCILCIYHSVGFHIHSVTFLLALYSDHPKGILPSLPACLALDVEGNIPSSTNKLGNGMSSTNVTSSSAYNVLKSVHRHLLDFTTIFTVRLLSV
jgi:hypothetical protein